MKETGITFTDESMVAILAGKKTQTRRLAKQLARGGYGNRFGGVGDHLWCREGWRTEELEGSAEDGIRFRADNAFVRIEATRAAADLWIDAYDNGKHLNAWRPPMFMRRWMARATLVITAEVKLERLQNITEADAKAEGCWGTDRPDICTTLPLYTAVYRRLWESINGKVAPWASNPFVWRIEFKLAQPGG